MELEIVKPDYDHLMAKQYFAEKMEASIDYLCDFSNQDKPGFLDLNWKRCAAHYLAIKRAESGDIDQTISYINYIKSAERSSPSISIIPIRSTDRFDEYAMINEIMEDDPLVGFGYCDDEDLYQQEKIKIDQALARIAHILPSAYAEIRSYIDTIFLTKESQDGRRFMRSGTNFYMWGMMFLYIEPSHTVPYYMEHLIHECAHTALNIINGEDELVLNAPDERFPAPFRKDLRPMIGIFHAYFVLSRICYFFEMATSLAEEGEAEEIAHRLHFAKEKLEEAHVLVESNAKLTAKGQQIMEGIKQIWKF